MWKTAFKRFEVVWSALGRPYPFKFFRGCHPHILLGPFLNTSSHMISIQQLVYILLYFQSIDIDKERICLEKSCDVEIDDLPNQVPSDKPRYHFFIFKHTYEGDYLESIGKYNENFLMVNITNSTLFVLSVHAPWSLSIFSQSFYFKQCDWNFVFENLNQMAKKLMF